MGSPVSPIVTNMYMEMFEEIALRTAAHPPESGDAMLTTLFV